MLWLLKVSILYHLLVYFSNYHFYGSCIGELTGFDMSNAASGWLQEHGEEVARETALPLEEYPRSGFNFPALFRLRGASTSNGDPLYALITQAGVTPAYCGTRPAVNRSTHR